MAQGEGPFQLAAVATCHAPFCGPPQCPAKRMKQSKLITSQSEKPLTQLSERTFAHADIPAYIHTNAFINILLTRPVRKSKQSLIKCDSSCLPSSQPACLPLQKVRVSSDAWLMWQRGQRGRTTPPLLTVTVCGGRLLASVRYG